MNAHLISLDANPITLPAAPPASLRAVIEFDDVAPDDVTVLDRISGALLPLVGQPFTPASILNALVAAGILRSEARHRGEHRGHPEPLMGTHITYFTGLMAAMQIAAVLSSQPSS